jgi:hypothetical protein
VTRSENGGVLVCDGEQLRLANPVDPDLEDALMRRLVPVEELERLGLDAQLVRNRSALMILPFVTRMTRVPWRRVSSMAANTAVAGRVPRVRVPS